MKIKRIIIYSFVSILIFVGLAFITIWFDLNYMVSGKISTDIEIAQLEDLDDSYAELYKDLYDFNKNKVVFIRFSLKNRTFYKLRNVKLEYSSDYGFERIGIPDLQDGGEVIGNPNFNNIFVVPFVIHKDINEMDFLKSVKYKFNFSILNKSFLLTN